MTQGACYCVQTRTSVQKKPTTTRFGKRVSDRGSEDRGALQCGHRRESRPLPSGFVSGLYPVSVGCRTQACGDSCPELCQPSGMVPRRAGSGSPHTAASRPTALDFQPAVSAPFPFSSESFRLDRRLQSYCPATQSVSFEAPGPWLPPPLGPNVDTEREAVFCLHAGECSCCRHRGGMNNRQMSARVRASEATTARFVLSLNLTQNTGVIS